MAGALEGKVAIVTGASRGIGKAIAEVFAREGAHVVICGRKQETLDEVAREIGALAQPVACHVGRLDQLENMVSDDAAGIRADRYRGEQCRNQCGARAMPRN